MSDLPGKIRVTSLALSHILDEAGVSERVVKKIQQVGLKNETAVTFISNKILDENETTYYFGSSIEGTSTRELNPDFDGLLCYDDVNVMQEKEEWKWDKINLLAHQGGDIPAGHCRLEVLPGYMTQGNRSLFTMPNKNLIHIGGRSYVKNSIFDRLRGVSDILTHGLAHLFRLWGKTTFDFVYSFKCNSISKQMISRIDCMRTKTWPTSEMLDTAENSGFFVVPIGHRLSEDEDRELEWRVSPSLAERCLMFSMNITQIKCYVILKMIKHDIISPRVGDAISSFHMKTVLFHCVENTPKDFWKEENLLLCVYLCIYLLMEFVKNKNCPNYFISHENLFLGKIEDDQDVSLESLFEDLMKVNGNYLFEIQCNNLGHRLREMQRGLCDKIYINAKGDLASEEHLRLTEYEQMSLIVPMAILRNIPISRGIQTNMPCFVNWIQTIIIYKLNDRQNDSNPYIVSVTTTMLAQMHSLYGSVLSSWCIRAGINVSKGAISFLERGYDSDLTSGRLKHASVLFCCKRFDAAAKILDSLVKKWDVLCVTNTCFCHTREEIVIPLNFYERSLKCNTESEKRNLLACDVVFTKHEVYCCPQALMFELFRDVGDDRTIRKAPVDDWMDFAVVDSFVFLFFLLYMTYAKLGERKLQMSALDFLLQTLFHSEEHFYHSETAYNLIGQCYEMEQRFDDALWCYRQSLRIRRRNNAALWLVTLLVYKQFYRGMTAIMRCMAAISRS